MEPIRTALFETLLCYTSLIQCWLCWRKVRNSTCPWQRLWADCMIAKDSSPHPAPMIATSLLLWPPSMGGPRSSDCYCRQVSDPTDTTLRVSSGYENDY
jgi:hypothetical protein